MSARPLAAEPPPYRFGHAFDQGARLLLARWGMLVVSSALYTGVATLIFAVNAVIASRAGADASFIYSILAGVLVATPFQASWSWSAVAAARGEPADSRSLVRGFERYRAVVSIGMIPAFFGLLVAPPLFLFAQLMAAAGVVGQALFLLAVIPMAVVGGWLFSRFSLAYPLALDGRLGAAPPMEAVRAAFRMTAGARGWSLFGLNAVAGLGAGLCLAFFQIEQSVGYDPALCAAWCAPPAVLILLPLYAAVMGSAYQQLAADAGLLRVRCNACGVELRSALSNVCAKCGADVRGE